EAQLNARAVQIVVELGDDVGRGDVDAGDGLGRDHDPTDRRRGGRDRVQPPLVEQLGVGEEERRIPTEQYQAGYQARVRISGDVVIALNSLDTSEDGRVRAPTVPKE